MSKIFCFANTYTIQQENLSIKTLGYSSIPFLSCAIIFFVFRGFEQKAIIARKLKFSWNLFFQAAKSIILIKHI